MGTRQTRLADQIRDILGELFLANRLNDPEAKNITVTAVKMTGDLQIATVYYRVYEDSQKSGAERCLKRASPFLRKKIAEGIDVRRIPELRFYYDESVEYASHIEKLLQKIRE